MSATTLQPIASRNKAGFPPVPPEPHQTAAEGIALRAKDGEGDLEYLRLGSLRLDERNVRSDEHTDEEIEELADLIDAQGLLQNLTVVAYSTPHKGKGKKRGAVFTHGVIAGGGRLRALLRLVERGRMTLDEQILCKVVSEDRALAVSLTENSGRKAMSTADTVVAFAEMVRAGAGVEDLAVCFHLSPLTVQRRLRLANVSPNLFDLFRSGEMTLDQIMALALTEDHKAQAAAWAGAPAYDRSPRTLRRLIAGEGLSASIIKFVGIEAYEKEGGSVLRDLFAEGDAQPHYIQDPGLMQRLAQERLEAIAAPLRDSGLAWVEVFTKYGWQEGDQFAAATVRKREATPEEAAAEAALESKAEGLRERLESLYEDEDDDADHGDEIRSLESEVDELENQLEALQDKRSEIPAAALPFVGAVVYIDHQGEAVTLNRRVRKKDMGAMAAAIAAERGEATGAGAGARGNAMGQAETDKGGISDRLCHQLTAHRTRAIQACMLGNENAALAALVHPLLVRLIDGAGGSFSSPSAVQARAEDCENQLKTWAPDLPGSKADKVVQDAVTEVKAMLPEARGELLPWLLTQPMAVMVRMLQVCAALSLNAISGTGKRETTEALAGVLGLQMSDWWVPTGASYLGSVPKALIVAALREEGLQDDAAAVEKMKKGDAVAKAEELLAGRGWLPSVLR